MEHCVICDMVLQACIININDSSFAYCNNLTIQCLAGSYAETFAKTHHISFSAICETELAQKQAAR